MASGSFYCVTSPVNGTVVIAGSFAPTSADSDLDAYGNSGGVTGYTVAKVSTGVWEITLNEPFYRVVYANASIIAETDKDLHAQVKFPVPFDNTTDRVDVRVKVLSGTTPTDLVEQDRVSFMLVCTNA